MAAVSCACVVMRGKSAIRSSTNDDGGGSWIRDLLPKARRRAKLVYVRTMLNGDITYGIIMKLPFEYHEIAVYCM
jgi:hypothetical protein